MNTVITSGSVASRCSYGNYMATLRSMTEGRGTFTMEFDKYEIIPANVAEKIIEVRK